MNIFSFIMLFGGLAFFLYGMNIMSSGLEKLSGGKLEHALKKMTSNPFKSLALGAGITIAIQSSSALTVMLVGLVNSGIMGVGQTIGVIMGSNIGTTLTAWILSLAGVESDNFFIRLLKPSSFSPIIAFVGIALIMIADFLFLTFSKKTKKGDIGNIFIGFAILMSGMTLMSDAVSPLADMPEFSSLLTAFENPLLGVAVGAIFTGIIQSSAASVGILQALSLTGSVSYGMALPIIMGQNIGTCVTALISSIGVNKNAKRVSAVHISFNVIGTVVCLVVFYLLNAIIKFKFVDYSIGPVGIAAVHSIFNVVTTVILLPFTKQLEKLAYIVIKDGNEKVETTLIDERLLATPAFAISECDNVTGKMAVLTKETIFMSMELLKKFDIKKSDKIIENENELDKYEDKLGDYLVKLSGKDLSPESSNQVARMLHSIGDFERISDHAVNLNETAREIHEKKVKFSDNAIREMDLLTSAIKEILEITIESFCNNNVELANRVEPLDEVIDRLIAEEKVKHIARLQEGRCTIEMGFILFDILANYKRIADHCSNIAVLLIDVDEGSFDSHEYLNDLKTHNKPVFAKLFKEYMEKYALVQKAE